jgi:enamine deaminase RidA (YjgF/YER057c/UK114 family)
MKKKIYPCFVGGKQKPYANCVVVGKTIYLSGMNGRDSETGNAVSDTIEGQTWRALEQIDLAMKEAGGSLKNLVKMTTYLKNMKDYQGYRDTERSMLLNWSKSLLPVRSSRWHRSLKKSFLLRLKGSVFFKLEKNLV